MALALKGLVSPQIKAMQRWAFRHRVTLTRAGSPNRYGELADGEVMTVPCLIDGTKGRVVSPDHEMVQVSYTIQFPPGLGVKPNDRVTNGVARDGSVLLAEGRVVHVRDTDHPVMGQLHQQASIALQ